MCWCNFIILGFFFNLSSCSFCLFDQEDKNVSGLSLLFRLTDTTSTCRYKKMLVLKNILVQKLKTTNNNAKWRWIKRAAAAQSDRYLNAAFRQSWLVYNKYIFIYLYIKLNRRVFLTDWPAVTEITATDKQDTESNSQCHRKSVSWPQECFNDCVCVMAGYSSSVWLIHRKQPPQCRRGDEIRSAFTLIHTQDRISKHSSSSLWCWFRQTSNSFINHRNQSIKCQSINLTID